MISKLLDLFPSHTHPLTLVSDVDCLLASEATLKELKNRGFEIIQEDDPVLLRYRAEEFRPFTAEHPIIIYTTGELEDLPYDLYQAAYRISLSLHQFFPNLAYPIVKVLSPQQIEKLELLKQPEQILSRQKTIDYLLSEIFGVDMNVLNQPQGLIGWLSEYHHRQNFLPDLLKENLVNQLEKYPLYKDWDVNLLISNNKIFQNFVQQQWGLFVENSFIENRIDGADVPYAIPFRNDSGLQDMVPKLVRYGIIQPLQINDGTKLPYWVQPGVSAVDPRFQRLKLLFEEVEARLEKFKKNLDSGWEDWNQFALIWSELCSYLYLSDFEIQPRQKSDFNRFIQDLDPLFADWLMNNYSTLGVLRLPNPHHVNHIPHYLAHLRDLKKIDKVVLLIMDCLSLADWQVIYPKWAARHSGWEMKTKTLLAQVPTITAISRKALISGLRPDDFITKFKKEISEEKFWKLFWSLQNIATDRCQFVSLRYDRQNDQQVELENPNIDAWCLIDDTLDKLTHNAVLGATDYQSSLQLWLDSKSDQNSIPLENMIEWYLNHGYSVFIASDHGHVEATGFGQPNEGLIVQTRGMRARIYMDHLFAKRVQKAFPETYLWDNDGLLPNQAAVLMPTGRQAFALNGQVVVTHGGISIDEAIVPFVQISKEGM